MAQALTVAQFNSGEFEFLRRRIYGLTWLSLGMLPFNGLSLLGSVSSASSRCGTGLEPFLISWVICAVISVANVHTLSYAPFVGSMKWHRLILAGFAGFWLATLVVPAVFEEAYKAGFIRRIWVQQPDGTWEHVREYRVKLPRPNYRQSP